MNGFPPTGAHLQLKHTWIISASSLNSHFFNKRDPCSHHLWHRSPHLWHGNDDVGISNLCEQLCAHPQNVVTSKYWPVYCAVVTTTVMMTMMTETWTGWISCWPTPSLADSQRGRSHRRAADWGYKMMMLAMVNCTIITIAVIIMIIAYIIVINTYWCAILIVEFCLFRWMTLEILMNLDCWKGLDNLEIWITVE